LRGTVVLYNYNDSLLADNSGVLVQLDGTSYSAMSDAAGFWTISNLPSRTYNMTFSKQGFGSVRGQESFLGGATLWYNNPPQPIRLIQPSRDSIIFDEMLYSTTSNVRLALYLHTNYQASRSYQYLIILSGKRPNLDPNNKSSYLNLSTNNPSVTSKSDSTTSYTMSYFAWDQLLQGFSSHDTMYVRLFPVTEFYTSYDPDTQVPSYTCVGAGSNVLSAVIP
jgi:hypothetical protein